MKKIEYKKLHFEKSFSDFLNKYDKIILKLFNIVASFKKHCPNTYQYSIKFPPLRSNFKYTDKLFIGCILHVSLNSSSWNSFIGPIPGKQIHKKFMEYSKLGVFKQLFNDAIKEYSDKSNNFDLISTDTSTIHNKNCTELRHKIPYLKNKKCLKISTIVDSIGTPLCFSIHDSGNNDCKIFNKDFIEVVSNKRIFRKFNKKTTLLADKGYDTRAIRNKIKESKIKCIISCNNRRTIDPNKKRYLTDSESLIYKKRVKVEHLFGIIKRHPKINCVYEKTLRSYENLLFLVASKIILFRTQ